MFATTGAASSSRQAFSTLCSCVRRLPAQPAKRIRFRSVHTLPRLPYAIEDGLQPFLSREALYGTAVTWHRGNLDKLNDLVRGTQYENQSVVNTVIQSAKRAEDSLIFGYASEALNNGYFLSGLTPGQSEDSSPNVDQAISNIFGSKTSFVNHFSSYAAGQFGSGYVWLIMDAFDNMAVVSTYGSGTVLVQGSRSVYKSDPFNKQDDPAEVAKKNAIDAVIKSVQKSNDSSDAAGPSGAGQGSISQRSDSPNVDPSRSTRPLTRRLHTSAVSSIERFPEQAKSEVIEASLFGNSIGSSRYATRDARRQETNRFTTIHPLLCLSLHPHVYIPDYGIMGKERYIENFWRNVSWQELERRYMEVKDLSNSMRTIPLRGRDVREAYVPNSLKGIQA